MWSKTHLYNMRVIQHFDAAYHTCGVCVFENITQTVDPRNLARDRRGEGGNHREHGKGFAFFGRALGWWVEQ